MKKTVVLTCPHLLTEGAIDWLREHFDLREEGCAASEGSLSQMLEGADVLIMGGAEKITPAINTKYPNLIYVFIGIEAQTSFDESIWEEVKDRVFKTGGGGSAVAETTLNQMTVFGPTLLQGKTARSFMVSPSVPQIVESQTLAVVGAGGIGRLVLEKAARLFGKVYYAGGRGEKEELKSAGYEYVSDLTEAFRIGNIVTLHMELNPHTKGIIRKEHILAMPRNALLINNARAGLVEPEGLFEALWERPDITAVFDAFYVEGKEFTSLANEPDAELSLFKKLIYLDNFFYTGHTAAMSETTKKEYGENLIKILEVIK